MLSVLTQVNQREPQRDYLREISVLEDKVQELSTHLENIVWMSIPQRLLCVLQRVQAQQGSIGPEFTLPVSKGTLALRTSITPETLSRTLPKLPGFGVKIAGKEVKILDSGKLRAKVCDQCSGRDSCKAFKALHTQDAGGYKTHHREPHEPQSANSIGPRRFLWRF